MQNHIKKMKDLENTQQSYKKLKYSYNPEVTFELSKKAGGEQGTAS